MKSLFSKQFTPILALSVIVFVLSGCGPSSKMYKGTQLNKDANVITVNIDGASSIEEATRQASQALVRERYRIDQTDAESGFVQTAEKEVGGGMSASVDIRLSVAVLDESTAEVTGEYYGTSIVTGDDSWKRIGYKGTRGDNERVSWDHMLEAAEAVGTIGSFSTE